MPDPDPVSWDEFTRRRAREYLESLHITSWGQSYDLYQPESKEAAVEFLADAFKAMLK